MTMEKNSDMDIEPGKRIGQFVLGEKFRESDIAELKLLSIVDRERFVLYKTSAMWFFIDRHDGTLDQITVFSPFAGKIKGKVGIGDTLRDVIEYFGNCANDLGVYEPIECPGVSLETQGKRENEFARIECISVSIPHKFYGKLPENIKRNLDPDRKRKLPG